MKLVAYTARGPHLAWPNVDVWLIEGKRLFLRYGNGDTETIRLTPDIIGFTDDGPRQPAPPSLYAPKEKKDGEGQIERDAPERRYGRQRARHAG